MKVKFIRLIRDCKGRPVLGEQPGDPNPIRVEPIALGGAVPGFLVHHPSLEGAPGAVEFIPASNVERAQVELEPKVEPKKAGK